MNSFGKCASNVQIWSHNNHLQHSTSQHNVAYVPLKGTWFQISRPKCGYSEVAQTAQRLRVKEDHVCKYWREADRSDSFAEGGKSILELCDGPGKTLIKSALHDWCNFGVVSKCSHHLTLDWRMLEPWSVQIKSPFMKKESLSSLQFTSQSLDLRLISFKNEKHWMQ